MPVPNKKGMWRNEPQNAWKPTRKACWIALYGRSGWNHEYTQMEQRTALELDRLNKDSNLIRSCTQSCSWSTSNAATEHQHWPRFSQWCYWHNCIITVCIENHYLVWQHGAAIRSWEGQEYVSANEKRVCLQTTISYHSCLCHNSAQVPRVVTALCNHGLVWSSLRSRYGLRCVVASQNTFWSAPNCAPLVPGLS